MGLFGPAVEKQARTARGVDNAVTMVQPVMTLVLPLSIFPATARNEPNTRPEEPVSLRGKPHSVAALEFHGEVANVGNCVYHSRVYRSATSRYSLEIVP
jgi:hypothetical protein